MLKSKKSASALSKLLKISPREMPAEQAGHIIKKHQSSTIFEVKTIIGLVIRKPEPVAATNQNTPPLQLPKISIEPRGVKGKAHSRTDMYSKKIRRGADGSKYLKGKLKNKSFVETHSVSKKNLMASHLEAYKSGGGGKDTRHKSVERQELFDKHFTNMLMNNRKYNPKEVHGIFGHGLGADYGEVKTNNVSLSPIGNIHLQKVAAHKSTSKENRNSSKPTHPKITQVNTTRIEPSKDPDDELSTLSKLSYMNAGARYELLSINQQLLDFDLKLKKLSKRNEKPTKEDSMLTSHINFLKPYENPVSIVQKGTQAMSPMRITQNLPTFGS